MPTQIQADAPGGSAFLLEPGLGTLVWDPLSAYFCQLGFCCHLCFAEILGGNVFLSCEGLRGFCS